MRSRRAAAGRTAALILCALPLGVFAFPDAGEEDRPLTNVDVVRMVMSEVPVEEILERIRNSPADFDVEPDIIVELEAAGVPPPVIEAMVARAAEGRDEEPPPAAPPLQGRLEIVFEENPEKDPAGNSVVAPERAVPLVLKEGEGYVPGDGPPEPVRLAFVLTCAEPSHVPDYWRRESRIGSLVGRHRLLFFQEATRKIGSESDLVYLDHPGRWSLAVDSGRHRGHVGVAVATGGNDEFLALFVIPYEDLEIVEGKTSIMKLRMSSPGPKRRSRRGFMRRRDPRGGRAAQRFLLNPRLQAKISLLAIESPEPEPPPAPAPDGP